MGILMKTVTIQGAERQSKLLIGETLRNLTQYLPSFQTVIVTDSTVKKLYGDQFPAAPVITIGIGEAFKTLETAQTIYRELIERQIDRTAFLVGIGGGIVCDVTGFVAATYLRGVACGYAATTLLAQVDASVGGKTGVNIDGFKNMVGVFSQPEFVICDFQLLESLPPREIRCGLGEVVKHAAIADAEMFTFLEEQGRDLLELKPDAVYRAVSDSIRIKAEIVNRDEMEKGERRKLNFGHTYGHAIEKATDLAHGEAVAVGMVFAAKLSVEQGLLNPADYDRLIELLKMLKMPTAVEVAPEAAIDALLRDKKRTGDTVHVVLLEKIGRAMVKEMAVDELVGVISEF
jgi:3-dehydroquinate synthase